MMALEKNIRYLRRMRRLEVVAPPMSTKSASKKCPRMCVMCYVACYVLGMIVCPYM